MEHDRCFYCWLEIPFNKHMNIAYAGAQHPTMRLPGGPTFTLDQWPPIEAIVPVHEECWVKHRNRPENRMALAPQFNAPVA